MLASRKALETQANDINMVTVRKMNCQQPVETTLLATPYDNKENSSTAVHLLRGQCIECAVGGNLLVVN